MEFSCILNSFIQSVLNNNVKIKINEKKRILNSYLIKKKIK